MACVLSLSWWFACEVVAWAWKRTKTSCKCDAAKHDVAWLKIVEAKCTAIEITVLTSSVKERIHYRKRAREIEHRKIANAINLELVFPMAMVVFAKIASVFTFYNQSTATIIIYMFNF